MKYWVEYESTGRILMTMKADEQRACMGGTLIEVDKLYHPVTDYVDNGEAMPRPPCPATLDGMLLSNLPLPCTVIVAGDAHELPAGGDDFAELEFTYPGTYQVQVVGAWPYLDGEFTVVQP